MNTKGTIGLKSIFSGPAYLSHIFYIIKNKNKIWEKMDRENSSPDILYSWTFDFIIILGLAKEYNNESKKITLTNEGEKLYEIIKNIDDNLLFEYGEVKENNIDMYEQKLESSISIEKVDKLKDILKTQLLKTQGYLIIREILIEREISKGELYKKIAEKIAEKIGKVEKETLQNRVPSMLQMAKFLNLFSFENGVYSITKDFINVEKKIYNNNLDMKKLTSQESLLLISLLTKPFSILYGVSGTGKSRVVKELWKKLYGDNYKKYFFKESVPPNWFDESEIIGRYNEIERYKEGSFVTILEKAIKDPDHNYIYLLDEMNLSHIEQYFSQYLSSIEDLDTGDSVIRVGDTNEKLKKIGLSTEGNKMDLEYNFNENLNLVNNYVFKRGEVEIDGVIINSDLDFADFHKKIFKFIIDRNIDKEESEIVKILDSSKITTISDLKGKKYIIENEENINFENPDGVNFYIKKVDWKTTSNYFYYKGYVIETGYNYNARVIEIKKLLELLDKNLINKTKIIFSLKGDDIMYGYKNDYFEYFNEKNEIVGKTLILPKNLFVVGTINLDETTKSISPKVVDRANIIEFNDLDNFLFIKDDNKYDLDFLSNLDIKQFNFDELIKLRDAISKINNEEDLKLLVELDKKTKELLNRFYQFLKLFKLHFSYRTLKEVIIFIAIGKKLGLNEDQLFDLAIMQKILPKLNGIIDYSFKLYELNEKKLLSYDISGSDNQLLLGFEWIKNGVISGDTIYKNTSLKLKRMQYFFDTYQNVNYFLS